MTCITDTRERQKDRIALCLIGASVCLCAASIGADHVIGVVGIRYLFIGMGIGIWLMVGFYRFIAP